MVSVFDFNFFIYVKYGWKCLTQKSEFFINKCLINLQIQYLYDHQYH